MTTSPRQAAGPSSGPVTAQPLRFQRGRPRGGPRGRRVEAADRAAVDEALAGLSVEPDLRRDLLIEALHRLQDRYRGLHAGHLAALAERFRLSQVEVFEVASFYHHFDLVPDGGEAPPAVTVRVCDSLSCAMAGGEALRARLAATLGSDVRVVAAPCIGRCDAAPAALVGRRSVGSADDASVIAAIATLAAGGDAAADPPPPAARGLDAYLADGGYGQLRALAEGRLEPPAIVERLEAAGLRGLGGAGFPAARKWRAVAAQPGPRLMVINADEGEPGTFKDRHLLGTDPHAMLEGALIAARVVGIDAIWIYLRDEYAALHALLARELALLAARPPVSGLPAIELRRGAGAYVCGEESSLIESLEGKRGLPRLRPPYVAEVGLFGRPTLAHNVETLAFVPRILAEGSEAFRGPGRNGRHGLRHYSLSGRVQRPGVHLAPAGISVRELIDEHGGGMLPGHELYAYLPGGASGGILPASLAHLPLDFDTLQPHGCFIGSAAVIVLSQHDRASDAARNAMRFFADESCGQCTPCRAGTAQATQLIAGQRWDRPLLERLSRTMIDASICGLGQAAPNPVRSVLNHFPHELEHEHAADDGAPPATAHDDGARRAHPTLGEVPR